MVGLNVKEPETPFKDITSTSPYAEAVTFLKAENIIGGYADQTLQPSETGEGTRRLPHRRRDHRQLRPRTREDEHLQQRDGAHRGRKSDRSCRPDCN